MGWGGGGGGGPWKFEGTGSAFFQRTKSSKMGTVGLGWQEVLSPIFRFQSRLNDGISYCAVIVNWKRQDVGVGAWMG